VNVEVPLGFIAPRLDEQTLSLGHPVMSPTFRCMLLSLQACNSFTGGPKVDDFRHVNKRRYPDTTWVGTDSSLITVKYADTVALDHPECPNHLAFPDGNLGCGVRKST
jgi:hypothetical protein